MKKAERMILRNYTEFIKSHQVDILIKILIFVIKNAIKYMSSLLPNYSRSRWPSGLRRGSTPIACWGCGFESRLGHECLCCRIRTKGKSQDNQNKEIRLKYRRKKNACVPEI